MIIELFVCMYVTCADFFFSASAFHCSSSRRCSFRVASFSFRFSNIVSAALETVFWWLQRMATCLQCKPGEIKLISIRASSYSKYLLYVQYLLAALYRTILSGMESPSNSSADGNSFSNVMDALNVLKTFAVRPFISELRCLFSIGGCKVSKTSSLGDFFLQKL